MVRVGNEPTPSVVQVLRGMVPTRRMGRYELVKARPYLGRVARSIDLSEQDSWAVGRVDVADSSVTICIEEVSNTMAHYHRIDLHGG